MRLYGIQDIFKQVRIQLCTDMFQLNFIQLLLDEFVGLGKAGISLFDPVVLTEQVNTDGKQKENSKNSNEYQIIVDHVVIAFHKNSFNDLSAKLTERSGLFKFF
jgi:hypothetical protein